MGTAVLPTSIGCWEMKWGIKPWVSKTHRFSTWSSTHKVMGIQFATCKLLPKKNSVFLQGRVRTLPPELSTALFTSDSELERVRVGIRRIMWKSWTLWKAMGNVVMTDSLLTAGLHLLVSSTLHQNVWPWKCWTTNYCMNTKSCQPWLHKVPTRS